MCQIRNSGIMLRHFLCVPYVRLHAETIVPARRPRFRRTNLLPRCLSKGFHADATNCKLVTPLGIHMLSARQRYYNLRTCSGQSEEVFPYLTPFTALGCAYERAPPGFPVQASRPRSASHPIGVDSLPHTHPSRAVAVCLHPYRQARGKSNANERQNVSPTIRGKQKTGQARICTRPVSQQGGFPCHIILSDMIHPLFPNARLDHPRVSKCR